MIPINFASRNYRHTELLRNVLIAASVALCVAMIGMLWTAVSLRKNISVMNARLQELDAADKKMLAALQEREQLVKDLSQMSSLIEPMKFSWVRLLTSLETAVPLGVALKHVTFDTRSHALTLEGTARSPEALRSLLVGLEKSAAFKDPVLKHQSIEKGSNLFNVVAVYHEPAGPVVDRGQK